MSMLKALKNAKQKEEAENKPASEDPKLGESTAIIKQDAKQQVSDFGSIVRMMNLQRIKAQVDKPKTAVPRRRYSMPDSLEKIQSLPFEPQAHPEWSPRGVAQDAIDYLEDQNGGRTSLSPVRRMCRDNLNENPNNFCTAIVHNIELDQTKIKKSVKETTLPTVTSVRSRTQRALSAEEVATNCEKSIEFFRKNRELNGELKKINAENGTGWSKLRKKFLKG